MWKSDVEPSEIAEVLGRGELSVRNKLRRHSIYLADKENKSRVSNPGPEQLRSIFDSRLLKIYRALREQMGNLHVPQNPQPILRLIGDHTSSAFMKILTSDRPPTVAELESLEWVRTDSAGVYGWILKPRGKTLFQDHECYLYVGSASKRT